ncbi:unnamed protein product [Thelazia callipaeda]|uniref:Uncharacterized protein n=1 Tax=Thelazia callipaeda TaxID=103827 RepID=A0A0N5D7G4_THECL|nr:unnamed protein product [Thelazia callipaeda]
MTLCMKCLSKCLNLTWYHPKWKIVLYNMKPIKFVKYVPFS